MNRRIMRDSSLLRQGRGRRQFSIALIRFRTEDSYEGIVVFLPLGLAELPAIRLPF